MAAALAPFPNRIASPCFSIQYSIDTQNLSAYIPTLKKEFLIKKIKSNPS